MKVSWEGKTYNWKLSGYTVSKDAKKRSSYHELARELIKKIFPCVVLMEEVYLPGVGLTADFFIRSKMMVVEVHGRQHYEFIEHFHQDWRGFLQAKMRDRNKEYWCEINNIKYVELPYNESEEQWKKRIIASLT